MTVLNIKQRLQLRPLGVDKLPERHRVVVHLEDTEIYHEGAKLCEVSMLITLEE